jgi:hypothetical protein
MMYLSSCAVCNALILYKTTLLYFFQDVIEDIILNLPEEREEPVI